jgi:hypothetical protein
MVASYFSICHAGVREQKCVGGRGFGIGVNQGNAFGVGAGQASFAKAAISELHIRASNGRFGQGGIHASSFTRDGAPACHEFAHLNAEK